MSDKVLRESIEFHIKQLKARARLARDEATAQVQKAELLDGQIGTLETILEQTDDGETQG